jgi:hypothetical protein
MADANPYQSPATAPGVDTSGANLEMVASGQKMIIYGILAYLSCIGLRFVIGPLILFILLAAMILGIIGSVRLANGMGYPIVVRILVIIALFIPLIGLITLVVLNARATTALRKGGYTVGLLGASR